MKHSSQVCTATLLARLGSNDSTCSNSSSFSMGTTGFCRSHACHALRPPSWRRLRRLRSCAGSMETAKALPGFDVELHHRRPQTDPNSQRHAKETVETTGDKGRRIETKGDEEHSNPAKPPTRRATKGDKGRQRETKGDKGRQGAH